MTPTDCRARAAPPLQGPILSPATAGDHWPDGRLVVHGGAAEAPWRRGTRAEGPRPHFVFPACGRPCVPQLPVCGVHPGSLLEWLSRWTFPLERQFKGGRARELSREYFREMLAQGTTTAALYTSAWPDSVEACFEEAAALNLHAWIGPPLMDVDAYRPVTTRRVLDEARALPASTRRNRFAVTLFALSATRELRVRGARPARAADPDYLAEQRAEATRCASASGGLPRRLRRSRPLTPRTIFAHSIWLWRASGGGWPGRLLGAHCAPNVFSAAAS